MEKKLLEIEGTFGRLGIDWRNGSGGEEMTLTGKCDAEEDRFGGLE
jgi:hypothetical protein